MSHRRKIFLILASIILPCNAALAQGIVVTEQHLATEIGVDILRRGGNAIDAAIAIGYAEAVVYPCCGNVGGGGFMLVHLAAGQDVFLDFRETAPGEATRDMFAGATGKSSKSGWDSVGVPGTVMGLETARERWATMSRAALMAPAIRLAQEGFTLGRRDAELIAAATHLENGSAFRHDDGTPLREGEHLRQPALAATLMTVARHGQDGFYKGAFAQAVDGKGMMRAADLAAYRVKFRQPVQCRYRDYHIVTAPPPSSGGVALCEALGILEGYDMRGLGFHTAASLQRIAEAERHAFRDRNFALGDPDFVENPVQRLIDPAYTAAIRATIVPDKAGVSEQIDEPHERYETTHYSVVDGQGNAVAVTYTLNGRFGAQVEAPGTGVVMNNEMDDFTTQPGQANMFKLKQGGRNEIAPGKRPLSSMSPTLVFKDGRLMMVAGSPNGPRIISVVLQTLLNVLDYGMDIDAAVSAGRIHMQYQPDVLYVEPKALSAEALQALEGIGYRIQEIPPFGASESLLLTPAGWTGANDPRSEAGSVGWESPPSIP